MFDDSAVAAARDQMLTTLVAQLPTGVIIAGRDGTFELVNDVAREFFAEHKAGDPIAWIVARVLLTGEIVRGEEVMHLDSRDEWRTLSISATPVEDPPGTITHAIVTFLDVTESNRARNWEPMMRALSRL